MLSRLSRFWCYRFLSFSSIDFVNAQEAEYKKQHTAQALFAFESRVIVILHASV